jgi:hypothetical protein
MKIKIEIGKAFKSGEAKIFVLFIKVMKLNFLKVDFQSILES